MGEWQPIETAPKDSTRIILTEGAFSFEGFWDHELQVEGGQCWRESGWERCNPTHWMHLPAPPDTLNLIEKESGE